MKNKFTVEVNPPPVVVSVQPLASHYVDPISERIGGDVTWREISRGPFGSVWESLLAKGHLICESHTEKTTFYIGDHRFSSFEMATVWGLARRQQQIDDMQKAVQEYYAEWEKERGKSGDISEAHKRSDED